MRLALVLMLFLLATCAVTDPVLTQARDHLLAGRGEEALTLLEKASRENPDRLDYKAEFARVRDVLIARWISQAEMLRQAGQPEVAAEVYRRTLRWDANNQRARTGLAQLDVDARHRALVAEAQKLLKDDRYAEA